MYNFSYEKVSSVDEAAELIRDDDEGKLLAGGQTMLPTMKHRLASPSNLVDLGGIQELKEHGCIAMKISIHLKLFFCLSTTI